MKGKIGTTCLTVASLLALASVASARFVDPDSSKWEGQFDLSSQPSEWVDDAGGAAGVSTFGNTLIMTGDSDAWTSHWNAANGTPLLGDEGPWAIEYKFRTSGSDVKDPRVFNAWYIGPGSTGWGQADLFSGSSGDDFGAFHGQDSDFSTLKNLPFNVPAGHNWSEFHTYRVEGLIPASTTDTATVIWSVDGVELGEMDYFHGYAGAATTIAGLVGTNNAADFVEFEHISFTNIPEPATLALFGLSGLLMLKRRRE